MLVKDVMTIALVKISPDNSVEQAARAMLASHVSGIPVVDDNGRLVGIISEGDLIRRTELGGAAIASLTDATVPHQARVKAYIKRNSWRVGDVMTTNPVTIDEDSSLARAAQVMEEHGVKRIPVMKGDQLVGIVSRADLLQAFLVTRRDKTITDDDAIQRIISTRLGENTGLEGFALKVTVSDGIVHLWGNVDTEEGRKAARIVSESVNGVRGVVEHFSARPS
ncbi:CBS domain-containing protein [Rhizobium sp. BK313]|uniref:CBS domain-containing protein n=1 Tax=Rhizobium sp. BK313 TaxID=2587081 RepID=UPI00106169E2|nr:CBS domain-containing protein [Rhizobium sp. BK313]MBB3457432.1 CBS domain-containing protein [Rhizobium sp. BK313]